MSDEDWINPSGVYVLGLENGKYYVGFSENMDMRIGTHFSGLGSQWTVLHPPIRTVETIPGGDQIVELTKTLEYMKIYGWENVRGGRYSSIVIEKPHELYTGKGVCYYCRGEGHFSKECPSKKMNAAYQKQKQHQQREVAKFGYIKITEPKHVQCTRCKRNNHELSSCVAKTNWETGEVLTDKVHEKEKAEEEEEEEQTTTSLQPQQGMMLVEHIRLAALPLYGNIEGYDTGDDEIDFTPVEHPSQIGGNSSSWKMSISSAWSSIFSIFK